MGKTPIAVMVIGVILVAVAFFWKSSRPNRDKPGSTPASPAAAQAVDPNDFSLLLRDGTIRSPGGELNLQVREVGKLKVASGRIVACDPMIMEEQPFERTVSPGEYPVFISIAGPPNKGRRVAAAFVRLANGTPPRCQATAL